MENKAYENRKHHKFTADGEEVGVVESFFF